VVASTAVDSPAVAAAIRDASARFGLAEDRIKVLDIESVTWPDSSLGCPQPGQMYLQVLTPGYRVTLDVGNHERVYHTDTEDRAVICASASMGGEDGTPPPSERLVELARADLAARLNADPVAIVLLGMWVAQSTDPACDPVDLSDASPGPSPVVPEIRLRFATTAYVYRGWGEKVVFCREEPVTPVPERGER
jgi:hypothetical protein